MSESQLSDLFDESVENGLKRIGYGLLAGLGVGLVLARSNMVRAGVVGLSVGVGLGMTYAETQNRFEALSKSSEEAPTELSSTLPTDPLPAETIQEAPSSNESPIEGS
uniref:MICOS complex subunit MIC10 n=1 Tax=Rhodosorus marinus TaxID=101924 RepID=A0A7S0G911_9RHOD|mmetsp:Transcript_7789/g.11547  ORF Transcript_7789/g.11547 Transcript_7789/m.11547 type:complete len:108 (+) Transcript_7789:238-561(+)